MRYRCCITPTETDITRERIGSQAIQATIDGLLGTSVVQEGQHWGFPSTGGFHTRQMVTYTHRIIS